MNKGSFQELAVFIALFFAVMPCQAQSTSGGQQGAADSQELAKKLQNPVASLISVQFQHNFEFSAGPGDDVRYLLNFQPVIPSRLNDDWNLITRPIFPILSVPEFTLGAGRTSGIGDVALQLYFSPSKTEPLIWGIGPVLGFPTASDDLLGTGKWTLGPGFVGLKQSGHWTYGALVNHVWSYAGDSARGDVSSTFLQPFVTYTSKTGWSVGLNTETTRNWEAPSGSRWTVPITVSVSKVTRFGKLPVSLGLGIRSYAEAPPGSPSWGLRFVFTPLFPAK